MLFSLLSVSVTKLLLPRLINILGHNTLAMQSILLPLASAGYQRISRFMLVCLALALYYYLKILEIYRSTLRFFFVLNKQICLL